MKRKSDKTLLVFNSVNHDYFWVGSELGERGFAPLLPFFFLIFAMYILKKLGKFNCFK